MATLHIGKIIRKSLEEKGMTKSEFARRISTSPQNIYGILKRKSIDTELLRDISTCLQVDFFQYYSTSALVDGDKAITAVQMKAELDIAVKELKQLQTENSYLKEIYKLQKSKQK